MSSDFAKHHISFDMFLLYHVKLSNDLYGIQQAYSMKFKFFI